jgi:poly(3-hydroxybutyrate) depolymerase
MKVLQRNLLAAILAATLVGCGGGGDLSDDDTSAAAEVTTSALEASTSIADGAIDLDDSALHDMEWGLQAATGDGLSASASTGGDAAAQPSDGKAYALAYSAKPVARSSGCGRRQGMYTGVHWIVSDGVQREYQVRVPNSYDPNKPYKVVFAFHPLGGNARGVVAGGFYGMQQQYGDNAIYVAPQGLVEKGPNLAPATGWGNTNGRDTRLVRTLVNKVKEGLCVDTQRVYAMGFSFGGMMSNAIGCEMGDLFRGIAAASGALFSGCRSSQSKVAAIMFHAKDDGFVTYSQGEKAREVFLNRNHCSRQTIAVGGNGCRLYTGCDGGKTVAWCARGHGGHSIPSYFSAEARRFFDVN